MTSSASITRIEAIDALRAFTMLLMLWVNDFGSLTNIPDWLQHQAAETDALGFSDIIFPVFLFVVGLSIPFAISNRHRKGDSSSQVLLHIAERSFALLLMGFFMVNLEYMPAEASTVIGKNTWQILMTIAFFLTWNLYPHKKVGSRLRLALRAFGYAILILLALIYKGPGETNTWMQPYWWGILGLIGWSYLIGSIVFLFWGHSCRLIAASWIFLALFSVAESAGFLDILSTIKPYAWIVSSGSLPALTMGGVFVSTLYLRHYQSREKKSFLRVLVALGISVLIIGLLLRPLWGISKIRATPSWTEICTGIGILSYGLLYWIIDLKDKRRWWSIIRPAGTATLTCYLVPYIYYAILGSLSLALPDLLSSGILGLVKSMVYALMIVWITGQLGRANIKLRI